MQDQWLNRSMDPESDRVAPVRIGDQLRFTSMAVTFGQHALERRQAELKGVFGWVTTQVAGSNLFLPRRCYRHASDAGAPEIEKVAEMSEDAIDKRIQGEDADITNQLGFEPEEDGDECEPGPAPKKMQPLKKQFECHCSEEGREEEGACRWHQVHKQS